MLPARSKGSPSAERSILERKQKSEAKANIIPTVTNVVITPHSLYTTANTNGLYYIHTFAVSGAFSSGTLLCEYTGDAPTLVFKLVTSGGNLSTEVPVTSTSPTQINFPFTFNVGVGDTFSIEGPSEGITSISLSFNVESR